MSRMHVSHRMRETSLEAYGELPQMGEMQRKVFDAIVERSMRGDYPTDRELAEDLGFRDPNQVRPRRNELMEAGYIVEAGKRLCSVTERRALIWKVSNKYGDLFERGLR